MQTEVVNQNINNIITALRAKGIKKKLSDIEEYINENFPDSNCTLEEKEDLLKYSSLPFEQKDYDNMMYIINQSYSLGEPYFLYTFKFCDGKNLNDLKKIFDQFINDNTISDEDDEYLIKNYKIKLCSRKQLTQTYVRDKLILPNIGKKVIS